MPTAWKNYDFISEKSDFRITQSAGAVEYVDCNPPAHTHTHPNECSGYDTKQSDGEVPVMLDLWRMQSTPLLLFLPGPFWLRVVALDMVLSMGQIELNCILMLN